MLGTKVYRFKVLRFDITTAVASFTRAMSLILGEGFQTFVLPYVDDLLIYSETFEEHILHLDQVFSRLAEAGMTLKFSKFNFIPEELPFLGYLLNGQGVRPDPNRVEAL